MNKFMNRFWSVMLIVAMVVTVCPQSQLVAVSAADDDNTPYNLSADRPVYVSSGNNEDYAVDGKDDTRWQADQSDKDEWLYVDLGKVATIDNIYLHWEAAKAKYFDIFVSDDEINWDKVYSKGKETGKYVDMAIDYNQTGIRDDGDYQFNVNWTSVEDAHYKVYVDDVIAKAGGDNYEFKNHGGNSGNVRFSPGTHTVKVVAFNPDTQAELGSGTCTFEAKEGAKGNNGVVVDADAGLKQTIDSSQLSKNTGRFVKIVCTERATAYGMSLYELQISGTGGANKRPANYGTNLALNKNVKCSGTRDEWWMKDENGNITENAWNDIKPENAVDGKTSTAFTSYQGEEDQWLYVDLGKQYTIGRVIARFNDDAGKIYDIEVSSDAETWTTIHRQMRGYTGIIDNVQCYRTNVRYVRVLTYSKVEHGSGFGLRELEVYEYIDGDSKENETIPELPTRQIINNPNGKGTYISGEIKKELNKLPTFVNEEKVQVPIDSNSWWSSAMIKTFGNVDVIHPLKAVYSKKGLGVLLTTKGFTDERKPQDLGMGYYSERLMDFYVMPDNYTAGSAYDRVEGYGDYHVDLGLCDEDGLKMTSTFVKGSPYIFSEFYDNDTVFINSSSITQLFDDNGAEILKNAGDSITTDHFGFTSFDEENTRAKNDGSFFAVSLPANTKVTAMSVGKKTTLKIEFASKKDAYMSYGAMLKKSDLKMYYQHGYAYVTGTKVGYTYDRTTSKVTTTYNVTTKVKRDGFSNITMQAFYPHQWKYSDDTKNAYAVYGNIRGDMKAVFSNKLSTVQQFSGLLPTFAKPDSSMMDTAEMKDYILTVKNQLGTGPNADAYWQGKAIHPLAITALMAEQIGETEIRDELLKDLKKILVDWFTYSGGNDRCYLIYNKDWGTLYYPESAYGANAAICDHHFTYGYFMFGAAVLSTYDKQFYNDYKDMIELLVRDYANPEEPEDDGNMFCKFRAFDQYSGHSWAGGYSDNDDGNNQESASESLFSWVGMYLWGEASKDQKYIDAGAYGFTTEMEAVKQYWFDYDGDNWLEEYPFQGTGQIYGGTYSFGTFFGGQPVFIYGIQWLPISEYLTNYGMEQKKCADMYAGLWNDTEEAIDKVYINRDIKVEEMRGQGKTEEEIQKYIEQENNTAENYATPNNTWQHITWPMLSQTDPKGAYDLFEANVDRVDAGDRANTLWFISAMDHLGYKTDDYVVVGQTLTGSVYKKEKDGNTTYTAEVWNPTAGDKTVQVVNPKTGVSIGKATVSARSLVKFEINPTGGFVFKQTSAPAINSTGLLDGEVRNNISGTAKFEDTQIVDITCGTEGAKIYYTTDGTAPTKDSPEYTGKFMVSSDTTVKAIAIKDGNINSTYASATLKIDGDVIESSENLALGKAVEASSKQDTASNIVDGDYKTSWQAAENNDEYIQLDLGSIKAVNTVKVNWEAAFASKYEIQVSTDGETWNTVAEEAGTAGEVTTTFAATQARYVRIQGIKRATQYGYNIYEVEVFGANKAKAPTITPVSGTYDEAQTVTMSTAAKGAEIKYTLDGTTPTEDSETYSQPFKVEKSTQIKAVTYRKGMLLSDVTLSTILISGTLGLNYETANIAIGHTIQLAPLTADTVTWSSSDENVATVSATGLVTGKAKGEVTITATVDGGKKATCKITVSEPKHVTNVEIKPAVLTMKNKSSDTVSAVITPADTTDDITMTWTSSNENVVSVNDNGTLTAKSEGTATITVTIAGKKGTCEVTVGPEATIKEMISDAKYNLALGKTATVSSIYKGEGSQTTNVLTDGNINSNYVATDWDNTRTSEDIIIDLGANYNTDGINAFAIQYVNANTFGGDYEVALSDTGIDFVTVGTMKGYTYEGSDEGLFTIPLGDYSNKIDTARYVKITILGHKNWGFQIREVAVLSTDMTAKETEMEYCEDPASFTVNDETPLQVDYEITAGANQAGFKYLIFVDGVKATDLMNAGKGTLKLTSGKHTLKAVSYYDGKLSEGIVRQVNIDDGSLRDFVNTDRNVAKGAHVEVNDIYTQEGSQDPQVLTDGDINGVQVETLWGEDNANIILTLEKSIPATDIEEVLLAFVAQNTMAKDFTIQFSNDGQNYQTVAKVTDCEYASPVEVKVDTAKYTQDTVKYVKVDFTKKSAGYGYQLREIAVMGTAAKYMPQEPYGLALSSPENGTIAVSFEGDSSNGQTYRVYIDDELKDMNLAAAGTRTYTSIEGGSHTVRVVSVLNGIESKGVTAKISIKAGETTTQIDGDDDPDLPVVTDPNVTTKPTTQAPTTKKDDPATSNKGDNPTTNKGDTPTTKKDDPATTNKGDTPTTKKDDPVATTKSNDITYVPKTTPAYTGKVGKTKVKKATKKKSSKKIKVTLKQIKGATKYQVKVSSSSKFKKKKTVTKTYKKVKFTFKATSKKLKKAKKLYIKARAVKQVYRVNYYGKWSSKKKVKIK